MNHVELLDLQRTRFIITKTIDKTFALDYEYSRIANSRSWYILKKITLDITNTVGLKLSPLPPFGKNLRYKREGLNARQATSAKSGKNPEEKLFFLNFSEK